MNSSPLELRCPKCKTVLRLAADQAGQSTTCQRCGNEVLVPGRTARSREITVDDLIDLDDDIMHPAAPVIREATPAIDPSGQESQDSATRDGTEIDAAGILESVTGHAGAERQPVPGAASGDNAPDTVDGSSDDDLGDLLMIPAPAAPAVRNNPDPFVIDENAPLKVEGITPSDTEFPVICHLCGSLMYGRLSQVGTQIRCHDCHSLVDVAAPKKLPDAAPVADTHLDDEDEGYRLEPQVELPHLETTIDQSLGKIDYDDEDFFQRKRELEDRSQPDSVDEFPQLTGDGEHSDGLLPPIQTGTPVSDSEEYGLAPPEEDLLKPPTETTAVEKTAPPNTPRDETPVAIPVATVDPQQKPVTARSPDDIDWTVPDTWEAPVRVAPEPEKLPTSPAGSAAGGDIASPLSGLVGWLGNSLVVVRQPTNAVKIALATIILGFANLLIFGGISSLAAENEQIVKFGGYALLVLGMIPLVATWFFIGITANTIIRDAVEQRESPGEWPEFSLGDLFAQFIFVATSFWLAAIPGLILGQVLWVVTDFVWLMPGCIVASSLLLVPVFLSSVIFNESPLALMSSESLQSIRSLSQRWIRYWIASLLISVVFTAGIAGPLLGPVMAFVCPLLQVTLMVICFWMIGDLTGHIVRHIETRAAS